MVEGTPPGGRPSATPTASNAGPRGHALWGRCWVPSPAPTTRNTRVAEPSLPAPEDGRPGEGQRLTPDAPQNGGRPPRAHSTWVGDPNGPPIGRAVGGGAAPDLRRPSHNGARHPPRGRPSATPTASNTGPQGRTLWGRCWVPTPAPTAPGTHGSRNPGYPLHRTGGRGRDST